MNRQEREKVGLLGRCRMRLNKHSEFVRGLRYRVEHDDQRTLTARQKWYLDLLCWKYGAQLTGLGADCIPEQQPNLQDYLAAAESRRAAYNRNRPMQETLL